MPVWFHHFVHRSVQILGHPWSIMLNTVVWAVWTGWTWNTTPDRLVQLLTVVTFEVGLLILYEQNRQADAWSMKMDELIRAQPSARNEYVGLEEKSPEELRRMRGECDA
jgi:low affinity Fe/Cu permease